MDARLLLLPLLATTLVACGASTPRPTASTAPPPQSVAPAPASSSSSVAAVAPSFPAPPATRRDDFHETLHGVDLVDPYRWLEDDGSPETRAWIDAQNNYAHALLDSLPAHDFVHARLTALNNYDDQGTPSEYGGRYIIREHRAGDDLWTVHVRDGLNGKDEVLLDPLPLSADHTTDVAVEDISTNGARIVYAIRRGGGDESELRVRDVNTKRDLSDEFPRALYRGVSLTPDGSAFYYALQDRAKGTRVRYHVVGHPIATDKEVFGDGYGPGDWVSAGVSSNGRHLIFEVDHGWAKSDFFVQSPPGKGPITPIFVGKNAHANPTFAGDHLIVMTDLDAPKRRIVEIDVTHPSPDHWRTIVPAGPDAIEDFNTVGGRLVVKYLHDATSRLAIFALDGPSHGDVPLPGLGTVRAMNGRWEKDELFIGYSSFTIPRITLRASVSKRTEEPYWRSTVPFASDDYETKQVWFASKDGTKVPMFLVSKKGLAMDGDRPTLLYGYGGFDVSLTPRFSSFAAAFIEQGGIYAVANLRGGSEFGEAWHKAGMLDKKQNVFDDFIGAAEWLIANKVTRPERLAIRGGSNGGLLVGAALTQRPELFRAVLCWHPDLDMLGFYRFKNNNPPALLEYGDASKPDEFKFLAAYSPYQKVTPGTRYPAVLLRTGDEDTRVPPLQARKMTARLQAATTSGLPVALLYDAKSGHAGGEPISKAIDDDTLELAFLAWQLGMTMAPAK